MTASKAVLQTEYWGQVHFMYEGRKEGWKEMRLNKKGSKRNKGKQERKKRGKRKEERKE